MKNNNLSNRHAPIFLIRVEDTLIKYRGNNGVKNKVLNAVLGADFKSELNPRVVSTLGTIFRKTDYSVDFVVEAKHYKTASKLMYKLPGDLLILEETDIPHLLNTGVYIYYVDDDLSRWSLVNHPKCMTTHLLDVVVRGGYNFE